MGQDHQKEAPGFSDTEVFRFTADVFQDMAPLLADEEIDILTDQDINSLWNANHEVLEILKGSTRLEDARENLYEYLNVCEKEVFSWSLLCIACCCHTTSACTSWRIRWRASINCTPTAGRTWKL